MAIMAQSKALTQPAESNGHRSTSADKNAPGTGDETATVARLASRRHLQTRQQLAKEKPQEILVRRPSGQEYVRVKPAPEGRMTIALIKDERSRNIWYAVDPDL